MNHKIPDPFNEIVSLNEHSDKLESEILEEYEKLNDKCDLILIKRKRRKEKPKTKK